MATSTPDPLAPLPLDWAIRVEDVPERGLPWRADASKDERKRISTALELIDLPRLEAEGRIEAMAGGSYRLKGRLRADVVQACVITLDPVPGQIDEPILIEFRPADLVEDELASTPDYDQDVDIEPIVKGQLETGRIVFELLSASLDPYPRVAGATLPDTTAMPKGAAPLNPFAVLSKLKDK